MTGIILKRRFMNIWATSFYRKNLHSNLRVIVKKLINTIIIFYVMEDFKRSYMRETVPLQQYFYAYKMNSNQMSV